MNAVEFGQYLSSNVFFARKGDSVCVMDAYRLGNADFGYGVWSEVPLRSFLDGSVSPQAFPDAYVESEMEFLIGEDFRSTYRLPLNEIEKLSGLSLSSWDAVLRSDGFGNVADAISYLAGPFRPDFDGFDPMTEAELEMFLAEETPRLRGLLDAYERDAEEEEER